MNNEQRSGTNLHTSKAVAAVRAAGRAILIATALATAAMSWPATAQVLYPLTVGYEASSRSGNSRAIEMAFDGNPATRWEASNSSPGTSISLLTRAGDEIRQIQFQEYGKRIRGWELRALTENAVWKTVATGGAPNGALQIIEVNDRGPYGILRLVFPLMNAGQPSITEIKVFGGSPAEAQCTPYDGTSATIIRGIVDCRGTTFSAPCVPGDFTPIFRLASGAVVRNAVIAANSKTAFKCDSGCTIENVQFLGQCRTAITSSNRSTVTVTGGTLGAGSALVEADHEYQTVNISGLRVTGSAWLTTFSSLSFPSVPKTNIRVNVNDVQYLPLPGATLPSSIVALPDRTGNRITVRNLRIAGYQPGTPKVCVPYRPNMDFLAAAPEEWNTALCNVSPTDVSAAVTP